MEKVIKNGKRIIAAISAVLLALMYILTLVFAIFDNPLTMSFFRASVAATILIPVLLYAYQLVFRVLKDSGKHNDSI